MMVTVTKADLSWDLTKLIRETDPYQAGREHHTAKDTSRGSVGGGRGWPPAGRRSGPSPDIAKGA